MHFRFSRRAFCGAYVSTDEQFVEQTFQQTSSLWNMLFSRRVVCGTYVSAHEMSSAALLFQQT
ncbi:hypothetical protein BgiMline_025027, partial [Biomphalaria glabrata]